MSSPKVVRPDIPLLLICALGLWASCAASYLGARGISIDIALVATVACAIFSALSVIIFLILRHKNKGNKSFCKVLLFCTFVTLGVSLGLSASISYISAKGNIPIGEVDGTITLESDLSESEIGVSATGLLELEGSNTYRVKVMFNHDADTAGLYYGARLKSSLMIAKLGTNSEEKSYQSGIIANAKLNSFVRLQLEPPLSWIYELRSRAISVLGEYGGKSGPLLQALVCGYRRSISSTGEYDLYKNVGLAHVVAVSGAHLAIVAMAFGALLKLVRCPRRVSLFVMIAFVLAYLVFAGVPISAVRASVMVILSLAAGAFGRRGASLNALAVCVVAFIAIDPVTSVSVSFFLSAGSTLGIIMFSPLITSWFGSSDLKTDKFEAIGKGIKEPLALTLSSNIVTLPFSVAMFSMLPLISPVSNIIATPLFTIACIAGLIAAMFACLISSLAQIIVPLAGIVALPLYYSVQLLSQVPYGCIGLEADVLQAIMLSVVLVLSIWLFWPKSGRRVLTCGCVVLALIAGTFLWKIASPHGDEIVMLDVGQGDSFLVRSETSAVLIDTGNQDAKLTKALTDAGILHLDALIVTHHDDDHMGSIAALTSTVQVERLIVASDLLTCECKNCAVLKNNSEGKFPGGIVGVDVGNSLSVGRFALQVVWPQDFQDEGGNADSICMLVNYDAEGDGTSEWSSLFTGDVEKEQLKELVNLKSVGDIDVLKVGHHGSKVSVDADVLQVLQPEISLISAGKGNRYGHPTQTALSELEQAGSKIYRTDEDGTVRLLFTKEEIKVQ